MIFPGHIATGYLIAYGVTHLAGFSLTGQEQTILLGFGALLGDGPDIDIFFNFLKGKTTQPTALAGHRDHITHAPIFWLIIGLTVFLIGTTPFMQVLGLLLWLCPWGHLLGDSIFTNTGVRWLWPFSNKKPIISAREDVAASSWKELFKGYAKSPLCYIEIHITMCAIAVFIFNLR